MNIPHEPARPGGMRPSESEVSNVSPRRRTIWRSVLPRLLYCAYVLCLAEILAQVVVYAKDGVWAISDRTGPNAEIFERHPFLVGTPRRGVRVERNGKIATIDSLGFRGPEISNEKPDTVLRVLALGGSTTFGVGVSDSETWPVDLQHVLDSLLQQSGFKYRRAEVVNAGVPGYTTLENTISLVSRGVFLRPDVVILFQGLNDLRNGHSPGLRTDYSNFHGISQVGNLELHRMRRGNRIGLVRLGRIVLSRVFLPAPQLAPAGPRKPGVDPLARAIFESNLRSFASLCGGLRLRCLLVPQVVTSAYPMDEWFMRFLDPASLQTAMAEYNETMRSVAFATKVAFADTVMRTAWKGDDFIDFCHFSGAGGRRFAELISRRVLDLATGRSQSRPKLSDSVLGITAQLALQLAHHQIASPPPLHRAPLP